MTNKINKNPLITIKRLRYLLVGIAILTFAIGIEEFLTDIRTDAPSDKLIAFIMFFSQYLLLIVLTYTSPNASDRQAILLSGGRLFLFITIPIVLILILFIEYDLTALLMLISLQWIVVIITIIPYGIDALFDGIDTLLNAIKKRRH